MFRHWGGAPLMCVTGPQSGPLAGAVLEPQSTERGAAGVSLLFQWSSGDSRGAGLR
jgi:hypothetical protein